MNGLKISNRGINTQSSPIRKLVPFAEKAKKEGKIVYHLNLGQPDIVSPPKAIEALKHIHIPILEYSHSAGILSLRDALSSYYRNLGTDVGVEDLIITTGGSEALFNILSSCLDPGDEIIIPEPYYTNYNFFTHVLGIKIVPIFCDIKNNFSLPKAEEFEKLIAPKTKAILITSPGNPTGILYDNKELELLKDIVKKNNLYLISDEVYREFCYDGLRHKSILEFKQIENNAIVIDSFSKTYSLCGIRIGAIVTKNKTLLETCLKFSQGRIAPPLLGQIIAEASLKSTDKEYLVNVRNEYQNRRNTVVKFLKQMEGVYCPFPEGAFYCMPELPIDDCDNFCKWILQEFSYNNSTVMLAPGNGFYSNPVLGEKQVRIAYVLEQEKLVKAMECLKYALIAYNKYGA